MTKPRLGIALGSGSARGWAHIGVLRVLQEAGLEPDVVCGTSIGTFVGAAYASGNLDKLENWARSLGRRDVLGFFDVGLGGGLIKGEKLLDFAAATFLDNDFADLERAFACVATDLASGREIWLRQGSVAAAVRASIALPGLFSPQLLDERFLVDGGLVNPVPVSLCRVLDADVVIAVDLGMDILTTLQRRSGKPAPPGGGWRKAVGRWFGRGESKPSRPSLPDVVINSIAIMQGRISRSRLAGEPADVLITPRLGHLNLLDYHRADEAIDAGRTATKHMLPLLRSLLD
ncbi:MAG: patatin-like phospholipase family protein [Azonexus sp.]|jgi:NTE family protein|uniref:patatin-like phospholipase family protein n=1 Tax=Azonexus sp. TaxID=1872668 RepID=UPI0028291BC9|nr:patatin-like phospholipase family protein [Azonexus sp.]MDR0775088.1 patatin-like phospholipase family protein [Azonexus sp.]